MACTFKFKEGDEVILTEPDSEYSTKSRLALVGKKVILRVRSSASFATNACWHIDDTSTTLWREDNMLLLTDMKLSGGYMSSMPSAASIPAVNDYVCKNEFCRNPKCSRTETKCWRCEHPINP